MSLDINIGSQALPSEYGLQYSYYDEGESDALEKAGDDPTTALTQDKVQSFSDDKDTTAAAEQAGYLGMSVAPLLTPPDAAIAKARPSTTEDASKVDYSTFSDLSSKLISQPVNKYNNTIKNLSSSDLGELTKGVTTSSLQQMQKEATTTTWQPASTATPSQTASSTSSATTPSQTASSTSSATTPLQTASSASSAATPLQTASSASSAATPLQTASNTSSTAIPSQSAAAASSEASATQSSWTKPVANAIASIFNGQTRAAPEASQTAATSKVAATSNQPEAALDEKTQTSLRNAQETLARGIMFGAPMAAKAGLPIPQEWTDLVNKVRASQGEEPLNTAKQIVQVDTPESTFNAEVSNQFAQMNKADIESLLDKNNAHLPIGGQLLFAMSHPDQAANPAIAAKASQIKQTATEAVEQKYPNINSSSWTSPAAAESYDSTASLGYESAFESQLKQSVPDENTRQALTFAFYHPETINSLSPQNKATFEDVKTQALTKTASVMGFPVSWQPSIDSSRFDIQAAAKGNTLFSANLAKTAYQQNLSTEDQAKIKAAHYAPESSQPLTAKLQTVYDSVKTQAEQQTRQAIGAPSTFTLPKTSSKAFDTLPSGEGRDLFLQKMQQKNPDLTADQLSLLNQYYGRPDTELNVSTGTEQTNEAPAVSKISTLSPNAAAAPSKVESSQVLPGQAAVISPFAATEGLSPTQKTGSQEEIAPQAVTAAPSQNINATTSNAGAPSLSAEAISSAPGARDESVAAIQAKYGLNSTWQPQPLSSVGSAADTSPASKFVKNTIQTVSEVHTTMGGYLTPTFTNTLVEVNGVLTVSTSTYAYYFLVGEALNQARETLYMVEAEDAIIANNLAQAQIDSSNWHMQQIEKDISQLIQLQQQAENKMSQSNGIGGGILLGLSIIAHFIPPLDLFSITGEFVSSLMIASAVTNDNIFQTIGNGIEDAIKQVTPFLPSWAQNLVKLVVEGTMMLALMALNPIVGGAVFMEQNVLQSFLMDLGLSQAQASKAAMIIEILVYVVVIIIIIIITIIALMLGQVEVLSLDAIVTNIIVGAIATAVTSAATAVYNAVQAYFNMRLSLLQAEIDTVSGQIGLLTEANKAFNKFLSDIMANLQKNMASVVDQIDSLSKTENKIWQDLSQIISNLYSS